MNKKLILVVGLAMALSSANSAFAQKDGGITPKMLKEIRASYGTNPQDKALRNAVMANGMSSLVENADNHTKFDEQFTYRVNSKGISDQKSSGRCWLFTGLNVMRSPIIAQYGLGEFFFSQNYSFFYDQLEKSNLFLQAIIDTRDKKIDDPTVAWLFQHPISDGGQFTGISENILKYGLVPSSVMPETVNSNNTRTMSSIIAKILRQGGIRMREAAAKGAKKAALEAQKLDYLKEIYKVLAMNLGVPPTEFEYTLKDAQGKVISTETYTPQSFYKKFVGQDLRNDFVMIMNDPSRPYGKLYSIEYDRHSYDGANWTYVNVPIEELKEMAIASLKDSTMIYYSCDVGKEFDRKTGSLDLNNFDYNSLLGFKFDMNKKERIETYDSGSSHAMTLVAVNLDKNGKPDKWMVENSWGASNGFHGHLIMTDQWFDAYTFRIVVNKKYVSDKVLKILNTKPTMLPPWDPMFAPEN